VKLRSPAHTIFLFLGFGAFLAGQITAGTVLATCCEYPERARAQHATQGTKCCAGEKDGSSGCHSIGCRIPFHGLISSGALPETMAPAWKSAGSYGSPRDSLTAREILALWRAHPQSIADRYLSSDPPIFLIDLALII
jgi:hypothetical protein